ncbi:addiction module toxin RelE [Candidatus Micrarchaeota archaeon]|nr:addiction module toxin RelE [Candidatus Micrarchaeota archaeon]
MTFSYDLSDRLKESLPKLAKRNKELAEQVNQKIKEIISCDENTLEHYKNLRYGFSEFKRVHVGKSFVLLFKVYKKEKFILFQRMEHHDSVYER